MRTAAWMLALASAAASGAPALKTIRADPRLRLVRHEDVTVTSGYGRDPFLFCSSQGTLVCQTWIEGKPFNTKGRKVFPVRIGTAVSRDHGRTWQRWTHRENHDDVNIEGGMCERADGTLLLLDTYVVPTSRPDHGSGEIWRSRDDFRTLQGPYEADFYLPKIDYYGSTSDGGVPHASAHLHRSLLELPNGDLLTLVYTQFQGDTAPSAYLPSMKKARTAAIRSRDGGNHWSYLSTVAVDGGVGTEGFGEPVIARVSQGVHRGRLLCLMRTGREMYGAHSDDDGLTWSRAAPVKIPGVDVYDTEKWEKLFVDRSAAGYVPTDGLIGALVDPDLIETRSGILVCAVGARIPARVPGHGSPAPQNGDYLAFSFDGGDTWTDVEQVTSGRRTTHYMAVREISPGLLYVVYDDQGVKKALGFQLEIRRTDR